MKRRLPDGRRMALCSVSTSWRSESAASGAELVETMRQTGITALELDFRVGASMFSEILRHRKEWGVSIYSLHAICPAAPERGKKAEAFLISDLDEENRRRGVRDVIATLRAAADIGAFAVVLHCGAVAAPIGGNEIMMKLYDEGKADSREADETRASLFIARTAAARPGFSQLLKSLDEINSAAVKLGINVGLENRYYFREFPLFEEFGIIFNRFAGGRLGYWHDTGHAHTLQTLFGIPHRKQLETFAEQLVGVHFHDVVKGYTDHNEPGCGEVDFDMVKSFLRPGTIRVMELNKRITPDAARRGADFLRARGIFA